MLFTKGNKSIAALIVLVLSITMIAGVALADEVTFKAGTYTGEAAGHYGPVPVTVTFSETEILDITVGENIETAGLANPAFERLTNEILSGQTLAVDTVSGATNSSRGFIAAVEMAVEMAGGNVQALKSRVIDRTSGEAEEYTVDVVVIGGGGAGFAAAASAAEQGAKVILLEKETAIGGNTLRAGGAYNAVAPERQANVDMTESLLAELKSFLEEDPAEYGEFGETLTILQGQIREYLATGNTAKLFDSVELHMIHTYTGGKRTDLNGDEIVGNYELVKTLCENALAAIEWLESYGVEWTDNVGTVLGALWPRTHGNTMPVGSGFVHPLAEALEAMGGTIMTNTRGVELITDNGRVVGVYAEKYDGTPVTLYANSGVVIATGGYGANPEMRAEYNTYWPELPLTMPTTNAPGSTGDGIIMAQAVGANLVGMEFVQLMPSSHPETGALSGGVWGSAEDQVFINLEGRRFVNEYASRDTLAAAALNQTDALFFIIGDQITSGNPQRGGKNVWGDSIDTLIETKSIYVADTLEELAEQIGIPADALVDEIAKYNSYVDANYDPDFGKPFLGGRIEVAPFWATPRSPSVHHTMGGIQIDAEARVISTTGEVIPGLYAAGEVTGGIHAGNRLGGNALADIMVFGRIAGANAALGK